MLRQSTLGPRRAVVVRHDSLGDAERPASDPRLVAKLTRALVHSEQDVLHQILGLVGADLAHDEAPESLP